MLNEQERKQTSHIFANRGISTGTKNDNHIALDSCIFIFRIFFSLSLFFSIVHFTYFYVSLVYCFKFTIYSNWISLLLLLLLLSFFNFVQIQFLRSATRTITFKCNIVFFMFSKQKNSKKWTQQAKCAFFYFRIWTYCSFSFDFYWKKCKRMTQIHLVLCFFSASIDYAHWYYYIWFNHTFLPRACKI